MVIYQGSHRSGKNSPKFQSGKSPGIIFCGKMSGNFIYRKINTFPCCNGLTWCLHFQCNVAMVDILKVEIYQAVLDHYCRGKMKHLGRARATDTKFYKPVDTTLIEKQKGGPKLYHKSVYKRWNQWLYTDTYKTENAKCQTCIFSPKYTKGSLLPLADLLYQPMDVQQRKNSSFVSSTLLLHIATHI